MKYPTHVVASAHVATAVQHAVTPPSLPRLVSALVASWYLPDGQVTPEVLHLVISASQHVPCTHELALLTHGKADALAFAFVPAAHVAAEHFATAVQHAVTPLSAPRAMAVLLASWYLPVGQTTPVVPHVGLQHVAVTHDPAVVGHFVEAALVSFMKLLGHVASAHVAFAVQQVVTPASPPRSASDLVGSWYLSAAHVTPVVPHLVISASQHVPCTQELAAPGHFVEETLALFFVPPEHVACAHVATAVQQAVNPLSLPRAMLALVRSW